MQDSIGQASIDAGRVRSYRNPVFPASFPDPFVLKFGGTYYGYSTGIVESPISVFPVIRSVDLVTWDVLGGAMEPLASDPPHYWAPEITYSNGIFYLYYSCGNEAQMEIRVATSSRPDQDFVDSGFAITSEEFAIDPHVFIDSDGQRYLFYATDFLSHKHIGTGTVVDRLVDWFHTEGNPRPVTRAMFDWQVYDPRRKEKGNVRWHTVEGPSVFKRKGVYFEMFSGGNWKNASYGVAFATSTDIGNSDEWNQTVDGVTTLPLLRSVNDVVGPGHNSIVAGPNNREMFCVYHSWVGESRVMSIDRLDVAGDRMVLLGPTVDPQLSPFRAHAIPLMDAEGGSERLARWTGQDVLIETTFRLEDPIGQIVLSTSAFEVLIHDGGISLSSEDQITAPPGNEDLSAFQKLWIEVNGRVLRIFLNSIPWVETLLDTFEEREFELVFRHCGVLNLDLTNGFVDLFECDRSPSELGWGGTMEPQAVSIGSGEMRIGKIERRNGRDVVTFKGPFFDDLEYAVNLRCTDTDPTATSAFGFVLMSQASEVEARFTVAPAASTLSIESSTGTDQHQLPAWFDPNNFHQFRFIKLGDTLELDLEGSPLASIKVGSGPGRMGITTRDCRVALEMVRAIEIL